MGFDTMRSFHNLKILSLSPSTSEIDYARCEVQHTRRKRSTDSQDERRRKGGYWDEAMPEDESNSCQSSPIPSNTSPTSITPPAFQAAKAGWSPPQSPRMTSPTTRSPSRVDSAFGSDSRSASPAMTIKEKNKAANALFAASCSGNITLMMSLIREGAPVDAGTSVPGLFDCFTPAKPGHLSPLAGAASHGQLDAVEILVANGASLNPPPNQSASSPLHQACRRNDIEIAQFLLELGADVNLGDCYNNTPLMNAVKYGSAELVALILSFQPDLSKRSFINNTALHNSVIPDRLEVSEMLLKAGANINARGPQEYSPLHCAISYGSIDMVRLFLIYGADPLQRDAHYRTPLQLAKEKVETPAILGLVEAAVTLR